MSETGIEERTSKNWTKDDRAKMRRLAGLLPLVSFWLLHSTARGAQRMEDETKGSGVDTAETSAARLRQYMHKWRPGLFQGARSRSKLAD